MKSLKLSRHDFNERLAYLIASDTTLSKRVVSPHLVECIRAFLSWLSTDYTIAMKLGADYALIESPEIEQLIKTQEEAEESSVSVAYRFFYFHSMGEKFELGCAIEAKCFISMTEEGALLLEFRAYEECAAYLG